MSDTGCGRTAFCIRNLKLSYSFDFLKKPGKVFRKVIGTRNDRLLKRYGVVADDVLALLETLAKDGFVGYEWDSSGPPPGERREGQ